MRVLALAALLSLAGYATAHGYVPFIKINGELIPGWDVQSDPYTTPQPLRVVRATKPDSVRPSCLAQCRPSSQEASL